MKFFEACERMIANGEFYRYSGTEYIYKIENDRLKFFSHNVKEWREVVSGMDTLSFAKWQRCENPEKPKDERPFRHTPDAKLIFDVHTNTYSNTVGRHIEYDLVNEPGYAKKWGEAITTFLQLKSAEGAYSIFSRKEAKEYFEILFSNDFKVGICVCDVRSEFQRDNLSIEIAFKDKHSAEKAISSIGKDIIEKMFKTFAGIE